MAKGSELSRLRLNAHERDVVLGQTDGSQPTRLSQPLAPMGLEDMDSCACTVDFESQAVGNPYFEYLPSGRIHRSSSATWPLEDVSSFACPRTSKTRPRLQSHIHRRLVLLGIAVDAALICMHLFGLRT